MEPAGVVDLLGDVEIEDGRQDPEESLDVHSKWRHVLMVKNLEFRET